MADLPRLPGIPTVTPVKDPTIASILRPMKESIEILGNALSGNAFANTQNITSLPGAGTVLTSTAVYDPNTDYTPPPVPTGFTVSGAFATVILAWTKASYTNHAYTEIWRATTNSLGSAALLGFCPGSIYTDTVTTASTYYYWIRHVSQAAVAGAYNASSGTAGATADDPVYVMGVLSDAYGTTSQAPFFQIDTATNINGVSVPAGTYIKAAYIADATITNAKIQNAAIDDAKIANLSATKITADYINADRIQAGTVTADKLNGGQISASQSITVGGAGASAPLVLSASGEIISNGAAGDKARLYSGNVEIYKNVPNVGSVVYKALTRAEFGSAANNATVTIPGYFKNQPKVLVSPSDLQLFNASYVNQSQSIQCQATGLSESSAGSMVWSFTPVATLSLAANTGQVVTNEASGATSGSFTSVNRTTPANTTSVTLNATLQSYRGTGTSGNYYYRTVRWKAQYFNGSSWVDSSYSTTNLGADTGASATTSITITFPSSGTWTFRLYAEAYDTGGSFNTGTSYEYATDNVSRSDYQSVTYQSPPGGSTTLNYSPTYSLPSGWEQTGQSLTYTYSYAIGSNTSAGGSIIGGGISLYSGSGNNLTHTYTGGLSLVFTVGAGVFISSGNYATMTLTALSGTVSRRRALTNSTTATNNFQLNYYNFSLSSAQVLATGSLNWIALGD